MRESFQKNFSAKKWDICVSFPHMKDAYWMAVDYGVYAESKREAVKMTLVEAGGYTNLAKQISQIEDCVVNGAQAVVIGAISYDGLNNLVKEIRGKNIPVIDVINGMSSPDISAKMRPSCAACPTPRLPSAGRLPSPVPMPG